MDPLFSDFDSLLSMTKEKAEKNVQEALNYLRLDFRNLGMIISQYHPLEVLKMAAWEERRIERTKTREPLAAATGRLLPVLLQSVVQSTVYDVSHGISTNRNIKEKDWQRIRSLSEDVAKRLLRSIECYTVLAVKSGKISEETAPEYRELLFLEAFPPVEDLERIERLSYMTYAAMMGAESTVEEKYGAKPEVLVAQMHKVIRRGLEGIDKLSEEASVYKAEVETLMAQKRAADPTRVITDEDLIHEIIKENGWEARVSRLAGERDDFDLFRPDFAANLPNKTYEALSVYPGTLDINEMMLKGLWPATIYPFLHFGDMYFSFVSQHIQSYSLRIMQETAGLCLQFTEATNEALRLIFRETDEVDVYAFDGNKVDVSINPSLVEVNAFTSPELIQSRIMRRKEEGNKKPSIGHKALIVEPDDFEVLRKVSDDVFASSAYFIIKSSIKAEDRKIFYKTIFGQLEMPEPSEYDALIDPDEIENEDKMDDDILADDITDEYEYESEDEDEKEKALEEKEKQLEESIPEDYSDYERSAEIAKLSEKYELTSDIIKRDEEMEAEADEYEKELDDDDFIYDESDADDNPDDDVDPEAEKIYDEAEQDDIYAAEDSPDQLTFFDELFGEDAEAEKIADEEFAEEEEEEFAESEDEAAKFSASNAERIASPFIHEASDDDESDDSVHSANDEMDDFPCFDDKTPADSSSAESNEEGTENEEVSEADDINSDSNEVIPENTEEISPEKKEDDFSSAAMEDSVTEETSHEENSESSENEEVPEDNDSEEEIASASSEVVPENTEETITETIEDDVSSEAAEDEETTSEGIENKDVSEIASESAESEEETASASSEIISDTSEEVPSEKIEDEVSSVDAADGEETSSEESSESFGNEEVAEGISGPDDSKEEIASESEIAEDSVSANEDTEQSSAENEKDSEVLADAEETTESLIDKGLVKPVESEGDGSVFVMTEAAAIPQEEEAEEDEIRFDGILGEIASRLETDSPFLSFLKMADEEMLSYLEKVLKSSWERQKADGKDKMFSIYDYSISVVISASPINDSLKKDGLLNNAGAVMYSKHKEEWDALILVIDDDFSISDVLEKKITPDSFTPSNWKICRVVGQQLIERGK